LGKLKKRVFSANKNWGKKYLWIQSGIGLKEGEKEKSVSSWIRGGIPMWSVKEEERLSTPELNGPGISLIFAIRRGRGGGGISRRQKGQFSSQEGYKMVNYKKPETRVTRLKKKGALLLN